MLYSAGQYDSWRSHGCSKPHLNPLGCFGGPEGGFYSESLGQGWNFPPKSLMSSAFRTDRRTRFISVVPSRFGEAENFLQMKGEQARRRMMGPPTPSDEGRREGGGRTIIFFRPMQLSHSLMAAAEFKTLENSSLMSSEKFPCQLAASGE